MHTTNYTNTFIEVSEDCVVCKGTMPPEKIDKKTIANYQFDKLYEYPYRYTSDEVLFEIIAIRKGFLQGDLDGERAHSFSKGQPCFRIFPLPKKYGWGIHFNATGKMAIYGSETLEYRAFIADESIQKVKAMRSSKMK